MSALHPPTREIYVRHTDTSGNSHVASHFVWDADKFIGELKAAAEKVNQDQSPACPARPMPNRSPVSNT